VKIYIAGPYTPIDGKEETRRENIRLASETGRFLLKLGHAPFCAHTMTAGWEDECTWDDFMRMDLEWLRQCDVIVLLPGWQTSRGARMEYEEARKQGLVIWDLQRETEGSVEVNRLVAQGVASCS
jgi:hypothetical protein